MGEQFKAPSGEGENTKSKTENRGAFVYEKIELGKITDIVKEYEELLNERKKNEESFTSIDDFANYSLKKFENSFADKLEKAGLQLELNNYYVKTDDLNEYYPRIKIALKDGEKYSKYLEIMVEKESILKEFESILSIHESINDQATKKYVAYGSLYENELNNDVIEYLNFQKSFAKSFKSLSDKSIGFAKERDTQTKLLAMSDSAKTEFQQETDRWKQVCYDSLLLGSIAQQLEHIKNKGIHNAYFEHDKEEHEKISKLLFDLERPIDTKKDVSDAKKDLRKIYNRLNGMLDKKSNYPKERDELVEYFSDETANKMHTLAEEVKISLEEATTKEQTIFHKYVLENLLQYNFNKFQQLAEKARNNGEHQDR